jgi:hypothetical protein
VAVQFSVTTDFFSYRDGIYSGDAKCTSTGINHALLVVGFGTDSSGQDFWIVQNSWGTSWGQGGFAKIARGSNTCGIANCATIPVFLVDSSKDQYILFSRKLHDIQSTGAMCLDGSPAGMYYSKGYGDGVNKTIIFFDGGGWCFG